MLSRRTLIGAAVASASLGLAPYRASARLTASPHVLPASSAIGDGDFVPAPVAWLRLVERFPHLHPGKHSLHRMASTKEHEVQLNRVQSHVNQTVRFDRESRDLWQPATLSGDCEDFAILKLEILTRDYGWPRGALTLAVCRAETGQGHAVLLAHTRRGVYVLDNRRRSVLPWRALPYRWIAREEPGSPFALWRAIKA